MGFLKADDTILVLLQNFLTANNVKASEYSMEQRATYVYHLINEKYIFIIDNSYGRTLLV